ncbi:MAG: nucleoside deaminase [Candidatus Rokuibacteriota bacterium]
MLSRRVWLRRLVGFVGAPTLLAEELAAAPPAPRAIAQTSPADPAHFMRRAEEMRRLAQERGDQPYGAVVVKEGRIVGEGVSAVVTNRDPTAHAEMEAIRDACRRLGTGDLSGCAIYSTSRPCRMCETACYWARIARMVFGADLSDGGPPRYGGC